MKFANRLPGWNYAEYLLLRGLVAFVNRFPLEVSTRLARSIGDLIFTVFTKRRKVAFENVERAFGDTKSKAEKERIVRESFRNLVTSLMEFFRIPKILKDPRLSVSFSGTEHLDHAFKNGKGVLLVISHLGSWEYLAFLGLLRAYPCSVVGRPMKNPYVYEWVRSLRKQMALDHIDKTKAVKPILSALHKNRLVAILIDQWASGDGLWVDFFGSPTSTTSIPARLAKKTGCALIPAHCLRLKPGSYEIRIQPEIRLQGDDTNWEEETTLALNLSLEEQIRLTPHQWSWAHRRWKGQNYFQSQSASRRGAKFSSFDV